MKPIDKDELYQHLSGFLKSKGIDLKQGSYTHGIQKGCTLLSDAINLSQSGIQKAKVEIDKKLDKMRQVIHERTAPKPPPTSAAGGASGPGVSSNAKPSSPAPPAMGATPAASSGSKAPTTKKIAKRGNRKTGPGGRRKRAKR